MTRISRCLLLAVALAAPAQALAQARPAGARAAQGAPSAASSDQSSAPPPASVPAASPEDQAKAQEHFQRAKDLYQAGSYRDAITELEAARALDPKAKELVFNLGIVHEKLARFDEAIAFFRQYQGMEGVTPAERGKAESIIKRIEGAKREVPATGGDTTEPPDPAAPSGSGATPHATPDDVPAQHGRLDAATITAASIAAVGLGMGATFGILALTSRPGAFVTGRDGTYATLEAKTDDAHTAAVVADVGFAVGLVGAATAAVLYFGRTKDPKPSPDAAAARSVRFTASGAPAQGGAMFGAVGTF